MAKRKCEPKVRRERAIDVEGDGDAYACVLVGVVYCQENRVKEFTS
jgi:hypothetical protein